MIGRDPSTLLVALALAVAAVVACVDGTLPRRGANDPANPDAPEGSLVIARSDVVAHAAPAASAATTAYVCPMHPEVVSQTPGTCPKCGMALVPKQRSSTTP